MNLTQTLMTQRNIDELSHRFGISADEARGAHGDAAFADYLILAGYSRRF